LAGTAQAQLSTATVKGQITSGAGAAPAGLAVVAVNKESGFTYRATTQANGAYVLTGLPPGEYEIRITGPDGTAKSETLTLHVGETASVDLALSKKMEEKTEEIVVTASPRRKDVKNSEVGTGVHRKVIEAMPQPTHNFLSSADLAPGVAFVQDQGTGYTRLQSGAQNFDNVNVFIDGVGQKNNVLRGGVSGQDSTRGNPFPQSAIAEYKVITQNYKAEYDQVSSAAITAVTKSGTNDLHGEVYYDRTETSWRSKSPLERDNERAGQVLLPSTKGEAGASVGGPIKEDVANYFVAYDYKDINDSRQVVPRNLGMLPAGQGIVPQLAAKGGTFVDPFSEHLVFGKVNAQYAEDKKLTASVKLRLEADRRPEDVRLSAHGNDKERTNNDFRIDVGHEWSLGPAWVSETRVGYQYSVWNPKSAATSPFIKYKASAANTLAGSQDVIFDGGSPDAQKRGQSGFTLAEDVTFTGLRSHVLKGGIKASALTYDLSGTSRSVDIVEAVVDNTTGQPYYDGQNCTGTNITNGGNNSDQCKIDRALAPASVSINNQQIGLYAQDDWSVTQRVEINAGVRWDVETNMLNNDYVTPADRVTALYATDVTRWNVTPPPGQTYAESLAKGGINIADYISDGSSRKAYLGAIAPRLGFSVDVLGDRSTVVFGGAGRSYDRTMANHALDEKQKNAQAGGEIWLMKNDMKMPYTDQASLGVRQAVLFVNMEVVVSQMNAKNQFQWFSGNRDANGGWATQPSFDPLWGGPAGYGSLILGDTIGENRTRSLMMKAEKPYSRSSGWSASIAYTLTDAKTKHREWDADIFDWSYGKPDRPWNPSRLIDRHRLVAAAMVDDLLPWGVVASAKYTFGSGLTRRVVGCPFVGPNPCDAANGGAQVFSSTSPNFNQVDVGLAKVFKAGPGAFTLRGDLLNAFNSYNYLRPANPWGGVGTTGRTNSVGLDNIDADKPEGLRGPMRTVKVTGIYSF
jgi:outer membrane receptor protein involved in Fe transport